MKVILSICGICIFVIILSCSIFTVGVGHVGIPVFFGKVSTKYYEPGIHLSNPLVIIHKMDLRTQKADEEGIIPSKEMLSMKLKTSVNYRIDKNHAGELLNTIGPDFFDKFIEPHIRSSIREVTSEYNAEQFFSSDRNEIQSRIEENIRRSLTPRGIIVESVMLKEVSPPERVRIAIESKQAQQQEAEAMKFRLQKERLEADRKAIEAQGIQNFQEIVKKGIDTNLLTWKSIEATEALAKSSNAKIVFIGNKNGLPIMLPG